MLHNSRVNAVVNWCKCTKITRNVLKGLQTFHNDYQRFEEKAFPCGKRAERKRSIYELARNARLCTQNSKKKGRTQGTARKKTTCYLYKLYNYKFSAADESTSRLHLKSSLRERGQKLKTIFLIGNWTWI